MVMLRAHTHTHKGKGAGPTHNTGRALFWAQLCEDELVESAD